MLETIKSIGIPILTFALGFFSKRWLDNEKSKIEHDKALFNHLDEIVCEHTVMYVYNDATTTYSIQKNHSQDIYVLFSEAETTSNMFTIKRLEKSKEAFIEAAHALLSYYAIEGLPTRTGERQSISYKTMDGVVDREYERLKFENEVMPKSDSLADDFKRTYTNYRALVKKTLKI